MHGERSDIILPPHDHNRGPVQAPRPLHRRGPDPPRRVDDRLAHDAAEPHRRAAGRRRSRPGGSLRGVRRQRRHRRRDPDLHCRDRVRHVGVQRDGGAARTPMRLGILLTVLNIACNVAFITGLGPLPRLGTAGAAVGTTVAGLVMSGTAVYLLLSGRLPVVWHRGMDWRPDWGIIRALFRFGLPTGVQGIAMNVAGVLLLRFIGSLAQSAQAQAAYAVGYTELFSFITWTSVGLMSAAATVAGQNLGARRPERALHGVQVAAGVGLGLAAAIGVLFIAIPRSLLALFGMTDPVVVGLGVQLLAFLSVSGLFVTVALTYTGGLQGTGDTRSPLYISIASPGTACTG